MGLLDCIKKAGSLPGFEPDDETLPALKGKQIALIIGHQPGGGAEGEREFNLIVADKMARLLAEAGAIPFVYEHRLKAYGARQSEMREAVLDALPDVFVCVELHFDAVSYPEPGGHHFQYRGAMKLAGAIRDEFQAAFPESRARRERGIMHNTSKPGAGFLRQSPGWAVLVEPFFRSNPDEWEFFKDRQAELAAVYCRGIAKFAAAS